MEELTLYVPNLEEQIKKRKDLQQSISQLSSEVSDITSQVNYIKEERKLYLSSVIFGAIAFQNVLLDFEQNRVTFKRQKDLQGNLHNGLYELLTSLELDFQPIQLSFVMTRPIKQN